MNRAKAIVFAVLGVFMFSVQAMAQVPRFAVISDPHFYDTGLGTSGTAL